MSLDLKNVELFVRAAHLGVISRAGAEMGLSATNASHRMNALEDHLGVRLFHRNTRSIALTPDGEAFLTHATRILQDVDEAVAALSPDAAVSGSLRVTASASLARLYIIPFVPEFVALYPDLKLEFHFSDAVIDIVSQGFDLAFRLGTLPSSSLLARKIQDDPLRLVATPAYLQAHGTPQGPQDLEHHAFLHLVDEGFCELIGPDGTDYRVPTRCPVKVNLGDALERWVLLDMGIGLASLWHVAPDLKAGRLVEVLPQYKLAQEAKLWAVRPPSAVMPRRVQVFLDFIEARMHQVTGERLLGLADG